MHTFRKFLLLQALSSMITLSGCSQKQRENPVSNFEDSRTAKPFEKPEDIEIEGLSYSDSMIEAMVSEGIEKREPVVIDTSRDLHSFKTERFSMKKVKKFNLDTIDKYSDINNSVTKSQAALLGVTDYFEDLTFSDKFNVFVFFEDSNESHYGDSFKLFVIDKYSDKFDYIILSQEYLSEGYEKIIESEIVSKNQIIVQTKEYFNTSNNEKSDDSISVMKTKYLIDSNGDIVIK